MARVTSESVNPDEKEVKGLLLLLIRKLFSSFEWGGLVVRVTSESVNPDEKKGRRPGKSQPIMHTTHLQDVLSNCNAILYSGTVSY